MTDNDENAISRPACTGCGKVRRLRVTIFTGEKYCDQCVNRTFERVACSECGKSLLRHPEDPKHLCRSCIADLKRKDKNCDRCGRALKPRDRVTADGKGYCQCCTLYVTNFRECFYCGTTTYLVIRQHADGFDQPACPKCRHKASARANCAGCHRPRLIAGHRDDGKPYCDKCLPTGHPPLIDCVDCGKRKIAYSSERCIDCGWAAITRRTLNKILATFKSDWVRKLFEHFNFQGRFFTKIGKGSVNLRHDAEFFAMLDDKFESQEAITGVVLIRKFGRKTMTRFRRCISYLVQQNIIATTNDPDYVLEWHLDRLRCLTSDDIEWINATLDQFLDSILRRRERIKDRSRRTNAPVHPKSIESAVRSAHSLLRFVHEHHGVVSIDMIEQHMLDLFVAQNARNRLSVAAFIKFVRKHASRTRKIRLLGQARGFRFALLISEERRLELIREWTTVTTASDLRWGLLALFSLIYGQSIIKAIRMKRDQIRRHGDGYRIRFAKHEIDADPLLVPVIDRWLDMRREYSTFERDDSSPFLFPGLQAGTYAEASSIMYFLDRYDVTRRQLMTTGLVTLIKSGIHQPKILQDVFGISRDTACKYVESFGSSASVRGTYVARNF